MPTPYSLVFKRFFKSVGDDLFFLLPEETANEELTELMNSGISSFRRPKIDLDRDDDQMVFFNELTNDEIDMIAFLMSEKWLYRVIMDMDRLDILHKDRDYDPGSQANMITSIRSLYEVVLSQKKNKLNEYTRKKGAYTALAGKGDL